MEHNDPVQTPSASPQPLAPLSRLILLNPFNAEYIRGNTQHIKPPSKVSDVPKIVLMIAEGKNLAILIFSSLIAIYIFKLFVLLFLVMQVLAIFAWLINKSWQRRRLAQKGHLLPGKIINYELEDRKRYYHDRYGRQIDMEVVGSNHKLEYSFETPEGQTIVAIKSFVSSEVFQEAAHYYIGKPIAVLYLDERNYDVL